MNTQNYTKLLISIIFLAMMILPATALTASIGNSRMVLRVSPGDTIERYILIKNVNQVDVTINITAMGDLVNTTIIKDTNFLLKAGEEKKAYFTIKPTEEGTTETKFQIAFVPPKGQGSPVGLSSTVIVIASGSSINQNTDSSPDNIGTTDNTDNSQNTDSTTGSTNTIGQNISSIQLSPAIILLASTILLVIIFLSLLLYYGKLKNRKRVGRLNV